MRTLLFAKRNANCTGYCAAIEKFYGKIHVYLSKNKQPETLKNTQKKHIVLLY